MEQETEQLTEGQQALATHMGAIASLYPEGALLTLIVRPAGPVDKMTISMHSNDELGNIATAVLALIELNTVVDVPYEGERKCLVCGASTQAGEVVCDC